MINQQLVENMDVNNNKNKTLTKNSMRRKGNQNDSDEEIANQEISTYRSPSQHRQHSKSKNESKKHKKPHISKDTYIRRAFKPSITKEVELYKKVQKEEEKKKKEKDIYKDELKKLKQREERIKNYPGLSDDVNLFYYYSLSKKKWVKRKPERINSNRKPFVAA